MFPYIYIFFFLELFKSLLFFPGWSVLDFPNLLPYDALMKVGNLTNLKILLDLLILIWDYFGCNVHDQCLAKFLFFFSVS